MKNDEQSSAPLPDEWKGAAEIARNIPRETMLSSKNMVAIRIVCDALESTHRRAEAAETALAAEKKLHQGNHQIALEKVRECGELEAERDRLRGDLFEARGYLNTIFGNFTDADDRFKCNYCQQDVEDDTCENPDCDAVKAREFLARSRPAALANKETP